MGLFFSDDSFWCYLVLVYLAGNLQPRARNANIIYGYDDILLHAFGAIVLRLGRFFHFSPAQISLESPVWCSLYRLVANNLFTHHGDSWNRFCTCAIIQRIWHTKFQRDWIFNVDRDATGTSFSFRHARADDNKGSSEEREYGTWQVLFCASVHSL